MSQTNQIAWMFIISYQKSPFTVWILKHRHQSIEVSGCRTFPNHNPLSTAKLFSGFLPLRTLMVRNHSGCHIGIQLSSGKKRRMSICQPPLFPRISQLIQNRLVGLYGSKGIHHLCKTENLLPLIKRPKLPSPQHCSRFIQICCRDTGRQHKINIQIQHFCILHHIFNPRCSCHIGNFMGICNNSCCAVRHDCLLKICRRDHRAL